MGQSFKKRIVDIIFIVAAVYTLLNSYAPYNNWDILPYTALILMDEIDAPRELHRRTYLLFKEAEEKGEIEYGVFNRLTEQQPYRKTCYKDHKTFIAELSYYKTKPLYSTLTKLLYKVGVDITKVTYIPSLISTFIFLFIVYLWLSIIAGRIISLVISVLLGQTQILLEISRYSTPDAISAMFLLLAFFLIWQNRKGWQLYATLTLSILTRIDNFISTVAISFFLWVKTKKQFVIFLFSSLLLATIAIVILPYMSGSNIDWFLKFKFLDSHVQYYFHVRQVFRELLAHKQFILYIILGLILLFWGDKTNKTITKIILFGIIGRLILFPSLQERFFVAYEYTVVIMFVQLITELPTIKKTINKYSKYLITQSVNET